MKCKREKKGRKKILQKCWISVNIFYWSQTSYSKLRRSEESVHCLHGIFRFKIL